jgi:hypothetical protein
MYKYLDLSVHKQTDCSIHTYNRQTKPIKLTAANTGGGGGGGALSSVPLHCLYRSQFYTKINRAQLLISLCIFQPAAAIKSWAVLTLCVTVLISVCGVFTSTCIYIMNV